MARRLIRWLSISSVTGPVVFICVIMLLIHVGSDRYSLQQLRHLQSDYQSTLIDRAGFNRLLQSGDRGLVRCPASAAPADGAPSAAELSRYREPCRRLDHILVQIGVVRREFGYWNGVSQWLVSLAGVGSSRLIGVPRWPFRRHPEPCACGLWTGFTRLRTTWLKAGWAKHGR